MKKIIPAILVKDGVELQSKLLQLRGLADWVQIDIMDGKFVGNTTITLEDVGSAPESKNFSVEAHLMVQNPKTYFEQCRQNNIKRVVFHAEAGDVENVLYEAEVFGFRTGVALNPETSISQVLPFIDKLDVVLIMSVNPGAGGQSFIEGTLDKIRELREASSEIKIEVDGGINPDNIKKISDAGADYFVVGNALFESPDIKTRFALLESKIQ